MSIDIRLVFYGWIANKTTGVAPVRLVYENEMLQCDFKIDTKEFPYPLILPENALDFRKSFFKTFYRELNLRN